jgi:hypothetical protein
MMRLAHVGKIQRRKTAGVEKDIKEGDREDVNVVIPAVVGD